ncbi:hypothetical protein N7467_005046 [Penicillium canescens]|nr:hypothetical protein N7467_005046 [Penicillium canescens]
MRLQIRELCLWKNMNDAILDGHEFASDISFVWWKTLWNTGGREISMRNMLPAMFSIFTNGHWNSKYVPIRTPPMRQKRTFQYL